ncbi:protein containg zinc-ribbon domain [Longilinea arvoryzae]|uniref:Protein containg zinc-ribbon domain n=1 Tax=Longilinea arvoryzae TaxID=360412 RepID=A0A0S7BHG2_9CHLR|nr:zinc ribbon domain-containing protein [Longilinea arvoryzae]GAP15101.1 protein containg zinc-ribbon domain [Longilinea arvoryzae]
MSDFFGKLKSGAEKVAFEADKMARLNKAKGDLEKIKDQIRAQYAKIGELYYTQRSTGEVTGPAYDEICQAIAALEEQARAKGEEVQRINIETYGPQASQPAAQPASSPAPVPPAPSVTSSPVPPAPAATKFCPNCGKEVQAGVKFCPDCGTNMTEM